MLLIANLLCCCESLVYFQGFVLLYTASPVLAPTPSFTDILLTFPCVFTPMCSPLSLSVPSVPSSWPACISCLSVFRPCLCYFGLCNLPQLFLNLFACIGLITRWPAFDPVVSLEKKKNLLTEPPPPPVVSAFGSKPKCDIVWVC